MAPSSNGKGDPKGTFMLLSFSAEGIRYLACELTDGLVLVYHTGLFGWTVTPFAFDVMSRVLRRAIGRRIHGRMTIYVDDLVGVTLKRFLRDDMAIACSVCEWLLGSQAMAEDKWETGRCIRLGYRFGANESGNRAQKFSENNVWILCC